MSTARGEDIAEQEPAVQGAAVSQTRGHCALRPRVPSYLRSAQGSTLRAGVREALGSRLDRKVGLPWHVDETYVCRRALNRFDRADKVIRCAVFLAKPRKCTFT